MDSLLFHPKLVHVPMALGVLMPLVAAGLLLAWWRRWLPARSWVMAVVLQAVLLGSGVLALRSGEADEERVEHVVPERLIEAHEEAAEVFVWGSAGVLAVMLLALAGTGGRARRTGTAEPEEGTTGPAAGGGVFGLGLAAAAAATLGTFVVMGLGYRTGQAGGDLVYRHGAALAYSGGAAAGGKGGSEGAARQEAGDGQKPGELEKGKARERDDEDGEKDDD